MKHAGGAALDQLEPLLEQIRAIGGFKEKSRGCFYQKSRAFLHFHEDPAGMFADVRSTDGRDFDRVKVGSPGEQRALIERLRAATAG